MSSNALFGGNLRDTVISLWHSLSSLLYIYVSCQLWSHWDRKSNCRAMIVMVSVTQKMVVEDAGPGPRFSALCEWEIEYIYELHWVLRVLGSKRELDLCKVTKSGLGLGIR